jgi:hypothetical protein
MHTKSSKYVSKNAVICYKYIPKYSLKMLFKLCTNMWNVLKNNNKCKKKSIN